MQKKEFTDRWGNEKEGVEVSISRLKIRPLEIHLADGTVLECWPTWDIPKVIKADDERYHICDQNNQETVYSALSPD